jgi:hypothetical protein
MPYLFFMKFVVIAGIRKGTNSWNLCSPRRLKIIKYYIYLDFIKLNMIKPEQKIENGAVTRIIDLITRIRIKLVSLGFSLSEVKERVLSAMGKVYKLKCESEHNL